MTYANHRLQAVLSQNQPGLFGDFPTQCLLDGFSGLDLTTRKLQQTALMGFVRAPCNQDTTIANDHAHRYMNSLTVSRKTLDRLRYGIRH